MISDFTHLISFAQHRNTEQQMFEHVFPFAQGSLVSAGCVRKGIRKDEAQ